MNAPRTPINTTAFDIHLPVNCVEVRPLEWEVIGADPPNVVTIYDQPVRVSPLEWRILFRLAESHGMVVSHAEMARVIDETIVLFERDGRRVVNYTTEVERIRRAVNRAAHRLPYGWIETLPRGAGWRLRVPEPVPVYAF